MLNICIWFIIDHKLVSEDKLAKPSITDNNTIAVITPWTITLSKFATSDELQFPGMQSLTLSLKIVWAGSVIPETVESTMKV